MSAERNKEIIQKVNDAFAQNNPEVFLDNCAEDIRWDMAGDAVHTGKDSIRKFISQMGDSKLTDLKVTNIISDGEHAACYGDMTMDEKGTSTAYSYCDVYRFSGDKIVELRSFVVKHKTEGEKDKAVSA